jgi:hypothetical protein
MTPWWIFALTFVGGLMLGGTIGALSMAMMQINRADDDL